MTCWVAPGVGAVVVWTEACSVLIKTDPTSSSSRGGPPLPMIALGSPCVDAMMRTRRVKTSGNTPEEKKYD